MNGTLEVLAVVGVSLCYAAAFWSMILWQARKHMQWLKDFTTRRPPQRKD